MTKINKHAAWFTYDDPISIVAGAYEDRGETRFEVEASYSKEKLLKKGFFDIEDAYGYGLNWAIEQVQLLLDRLLVMRQLEYKDE